MALTNILKKFKAGSQQLYQQLKPALNFTDDKFKFLFYLVSTGELMDKGFTFLQHHCIDFRDKEVGSKFISVWEFLPLQLASLRKENDEENDD